MIGGSRPDERRLMEEQSRQERHMQQLAQAPEVGPGSVADDYIEIIRSEMNTETLKVLDMLIIKDFALGNVNEAELHELKWLREITKLKLSAILPSDNTAMKGKKRELVYTKNGAKDTEALPLEPLDEYEDLLVDGIFEVAHWMASRSLGGFQWDQIAKSYTVSEIRDRDEEESGWLAFG